MLPEVAYADYAALGGTADEGGFAASLRVAEAAVREVMGLNEPEGGRQEAAYVRAVCAAVDVDRAYGGSGGVGESMVSARLGDFSATFGSNVAGSLSAPSPYEVDMRRAVRRELSGSGLLYQGLA